jgi:hypothetical protein
VAVQPSTTHGSIARRAPNVSLNPQDHHDPGKRKISMRQILLLIFCFLAFSASAFAQASETFEIATFRPPAGWKKQEKPAAITYTTSDESKGTYALITLWASGESVGNARQDFESDWQEFVVEQFTVNARPEFEPEKTDAGWKILTGGAAFQNNLGPAAVLMSTYSGNGRKFSVSAMFNSRDHLPAIEAFASSIKLKTTERGKQLNATAKKQQPQTADNRSGSRPSVTEFFWKQSQSRRDVGGYAGYSRNTYQFNANGTYVFSRVDFQNHAPKYSLEMKKGHKRSPETKLRSAQERRFSGAIKVKRKTHL